jgi:hypothetical protein
MCDRAQAATQVAGQADVWEPAVHYMVCSGQPSSSTRLSPAAQDPGTAAHLLTLCPVSLEEQQQVRLDW